MLSECDISDASNLGFLDHAGDYSLMWGFLANGLPLGLGITSFIIVFFVIIFKNRVSLWSPGWPGAHYVDQSGLALKKTHLLLPPTR